LRELVTSCQKVKMAVTSCRISSVLCELEIKIIDKTKQNYLLFVQMYMINNKDAKLAQNNSYLGIKCVI